MTGYRLHHEGRHDLQQLLAQLHVIKTMKGFWTMKESVHEPLKNHAVDDLRQPRWAHFGQPIPWETIQSSGVMDYQDQGSNAY
ncbi:hypothetical protein ACKKBF_B40720 [Auxenochlorella protothecoides x Auxenochlorella symbiontica]